VDKIIVGVAGTGVVLLAGLITYGELRPRHQVGPVPQTYTAASASFRALFPRTPKETHSVGTAGTQYLFVGGTASSDQFLAVGVTPRGLVAQRSFDQTYESDVIVGHHTLKSGDGPIVTVTASGGYIRASKGSYKSHGGTVGVGNFTWRPKHAVFVETVYLTGKAVEYAVEAGASTSKAVEALVASVRPIGS
jgi:hypothetical protein